MKVFKKYTSICLLFVFFWILFPGGWLHDAFADHDDTDDLNCELYHGELGTHFEKVHVHCELFKTNTTLYYCPAITEFVKKIINPQPVYFVSYTTGDIHTYVVSRPARAPPVA